MASAGNVQITSMQAAVCAAPHVGRGWKAAENNTMSGTTPM